MKKFIDLVKNESLKLWGQRSFRVLLIIIGVILVLSPLSNLAIEASLSSLSYDNMTHEDYKQQADEARAAGEELEAREYEVYYETILYFVEQELAYSSVEYALYYYTYLDLSLARSSLALIESGEYTPEQLKLSYYSSLDELYAFLVDYGYYDDMGATGYLQYNVLDVVNTALADRSASEWIKTLDSELDSLRFNIENFSMKSYYEQIKDYAVEMVTYYSAERDAALEMIKNTDLPKSDTSYYNALVDYCTDVISCYESYGEGIDYLLLNDCEYASWEYNTVEGILYNSAYSCESSMPVTQDEFSTLPYRFSYSDFEDYNEDMKNERLLALEAQEYALCSLANAIPLSAALASSTKAAVADQFRSFGGMLAILFICYAGVMMAQEYSSGTIRLLLIKPCSRKRIIWSKFACMAFWWIIIAASALIILSAENMLVLGVNDIFVPDLKAVRGGIAKIPSFVTFLGIFGEEFVLAMLYVAFATLFAVLTKKSVLSIVFPMLVSLGASAIQVFCVTLYDYGATFLAYTPFFYLDFSFLHITAADCFSASYDVYTTTSIILGKHANIWIGIALIAAVTVLVALWAQRAFRKQKI